MIYQMLMIVLMSTSLMSLLISHPTSFVVMIMAQTLLIAMLTSMYQKTFWFGYTLFLVFLGGMLILFSYITSLAQNTPLSLPTNKMYMTAPLMLMLSTIALSTYNSPYNTPSSPSTPALNDMMNKFYFQISPLTFLTIIYLLITLLIVVNMTSIHSGPLRPQKF